MIESIIRPLRLTGITLRGIKSYLKGARLDIRPLTILCGANGSGKSTWIEVLDLLRRSAEADDACFPFRLKPKQGRPVKEFANAYLESWRVRKLREGEKDRDGHREELEKHSSADQDRDFGPLGTIGLEAGASRDWDFRDKLIQALKQQGLIAAEAATVDNEQSGLPPAAELVQRLVIREGALVRIRITDPELSPWGEGLIELSLDDQTLVQFRKPHGKDEYDARVSQDVFGVPYPPKPKELRPLLAVATVALEDRAGPQFRAHEPTSTEASPVPDPMEWLCWCGWVCLQLIMVEILDGLFSLDAVRPRLSNDWIEKSFDPQERGPNANRRDVGADGRMTHAVYGEYCDRRMVQGTRPHGGFLSSDWHWLSDEFKPEVLRAFKQCAGLKEDEPVQAYLFETFFGVWMSYLVDAYPTREGMDSDSLSHDWSGEDVKPSGFILDGVPEDELKNHRTGIEWSSFRRFFHPCLYGSGDNVTPGQLSSGFHQVAPIVVQAGLMRCGETLCVENPEVHLHPRAQGRICEFLINEARCGKQFIVETHSDLVVYRVMRAILEEVLPQKAVRIHFTWLDNVNPAAYDGRERRELDTPAMPAFSKVDLVEVDEHGRITNWPSGFLDEQVAEARRLLDIMYGARPEPEGDEQ